MTEPAGYSGTAEGEANARAAGDTVGRGACTAVGAGAAEELCGQVGAIVAGELYRAWNTDPSKGDLRIPSHVARVRDRVRRAGLARALDQVLLVLEAATGRKRPELVNELTARGLEIVYTKPDEKQTWVDTGNPPYGGDLVAIPYELAPPSWLTPPPYPPTDDTAELFNRGFTNEGRVELEQWAQKLSDLGASLAAILGKPALIQATTVQMAPIAMGSSRRVLLSAPAAETAAHRVPVAASKRSWGSAALRVGGAAVLTAGAGLLLRALA